MRLMSLIAALLIITSIIAGGCANKAAEPAAAPASIQTQEPATAPAASNVKEFSMTAKTWEFDPGTITVNKGDLVKIHITSADVDHGFGLDAYGIKKDIPTGKTVDVEFTADKAGTFTYICTVYCGQGHRAMKGQLVVN